MVAASPHQLSVSPVRAGIRLSADCRQVLAGIDAVIVGVIGGLRWRIKIATLP
jgi:hypothetical protein